MEYPKTVRILLVEDSRDHAVFFQAALGKAFEHAHEVKVVSSLSACFDELPLARYDLVVLDLGLPESQGLDTVETFFRVLGPSNPVIVLTANSNEGLGEQSLRMGAIDFLTKGEFGADQLARAVRYGLERWRQRMELEEAQRNLKSFAHVAAHDLKSPIKSIGLYATLLKQKARARQVEEEELEFLAYIESFTDQAEKLVDSLLHFSVLGDKSLTLGTVDVSGLARQAVSNLSALVHERNATVHIGQLHEVQADEGLLIHVLQNLIANAIKYHGERAPVIRISAVESAECTEISVEDNGRGIDPKYFERIFEPFKRLVGQGQSEGVGLGLAICQRVVSSHGGRIWVESELEAGSTFKFTLPRMDSAAVSARLIQEAMV
ncbi:ATP-binding protein [Pelagicoccus sp. SDUM812002]|uniref:sensor histidine kinase n=1 Tax=Pelagicoccus sp. SDUM812002 TaxID=3041266 RepID=UPI00280D9D1A|nr:ATP-binding protein [Pelagicoccus sp. SDUM812002]MDQ8187958.1 ATP-binding protein [Pelagicoccus sp. SDUM812002]